MQQKVGRKILLVALMLLVLPVAAGKVAKAAVPTPENDYKQGKVYKISPKNPFLIRLLSFYNLDAVFKNNGNIRRNEYRIGNRVRSFLQYKRPLSCFLEFLHNAG